jgi:hypothetical protein
MTLGRPWLIVLFGIGGGVVAGSASCRPSIALAMGVISVCGLGYVGIGASREPRRSPITRMRWLAAKRAGPLMAVFGAAGASVALFAWLTLRSGSCR